MSFFEELLYHDESDCLDFKREQYRFTGASDHEKSELLKDILAFAKSWRRVDAYILIGVEEVKGGKSIVHGIAETDHLDDADLQEFVNKKTNRHIEFAYRTEPLEGKSIGVIRLPVQKRPFSLRICNTGDVQIDSLRVQLDFPEGDTLFIQEGEPDEPSTTNVADLSGILAHREDDPSVERVQGGWRICFPVGSLQPKADFWTDSMFIGCTSDAEIRATVKTFGKQLADPTISELVFAFSVSSEEQDFRSIISPNAEEQED